MTISAYPNSDGSITASAIGPTGTRSAKLSLGSVGFSQNSSNVNGQWSGLTPGTNYTVFSSYWSGLNGGGTRLGGESVSVTSTVSVSCSISADPVGLGPGYAIMSWSGPPTAGAYAFQNVVVSASSFGPFTSSASSGSTTGYVGFGPVHMSVTFYYTGYSILASSAVDMGSPSGGGGGGGTPPPTGPQIAVRQGDGSWVREPMAAGLQVRTSGGVWVST